MQIDAECHMIAAVNSSAQKYKYGIDIKMRTV